VFLADPGVLGKNIRSESHANTVVGVAPPEFAGIYAPRPSTFGCRSAPGPAMPPTTAAEWYSDVSSLALECQRAAAELNAVATDLGAEFDGAPQLFLNV
jgi:hypothetical protein